MVDIDIERYDRQLAEIKQKRRAAVKRKRERTRRQEKRRQAIIGKLCVEHGDASLMAQIHALLKAHVAVADMELWPDLFPDQAPAVKTQTTTEMPNHRVEQTLNDLKETAGQSGQETPEDTAQFYEHNALRADYSC